MKNNCFDPPEENSSEEKCPCDQYCLNPNDCPNKR